MKNKRTQGNLHSHPIATALLRRLMEKDALALNGNEAAVAMGVSRVAIWKHLRKLREAGLPVLSLPRRGYWLHPGDYPLNPDVIAAGIEQDTELAGVTFMPTTGSTNEDAHRRLSEGAKCPFAIVASEQTSGRGRLGKSWQSPPGGNLYISVAFRPMVSPAALEDFSLLTGLQLCQSIGSRTGIPIQLKWPNDLWVGGRKLAGLLMEARVEADLVTSLVLGFGINVATAPESLSSSATSLLAEGCGEVTLNALASLIISTILRTASDRNSSYRREELDRLWSRYSLLKDQKIEATSPSGFRLSGNCEGIDHRGSLILRTSDGNRHVIRSGEISIRPTT